MESSPERPDRCDEALRRWARRRTRLGPPEAGQQVVAAVRQRRIRRSRRWAILAAAAALVVAVPLSLDWSRNDRADQPLPVPSRSEVADLAEGQLLIWLDDQTPLYMTFQPPGGLDQPGDAR